MIFEPFFCAQLEFVLAGPFEAVARWHRQLVAKKLVGLFYEATVVFCVEVDVHISSQRRILIADHRWASRKRNLRQITQRHLSVRWCGDKNLAKLIEIVPEVGGVANRDWVAFPSFHILGNVVAANAGGDDALDIAYGQAVSRRFSSIDFDIDVKALRHAFREDRPHFRQRAQNLLHLAAELLDALKAPGP